MQIIDNTYNQPPQGWRPAVGRVGGMKYIFPSWLAQYAVATYVLALLAVSLLYSYYTLPWYYMLSGIVSVLVLFVYGRTLAAQTTVLKIRKEKVFERQIFVVSLVLRLVWMALIFYLFMMHYGDPFGFDNADAAYYDKLGQSFATAISQGHFMKSWAAVQVYSDVSDLGYGVYVGLIYWLTGSSGEGIMAAPTGGTIGSIIVLRVLKCVWSALTVVFVYRLAKRNFGEQTGRIAAIFCALWPNFWYYCGVQLKETEMVFLIVLFMEQADLMLRSKQFRAWKIILILLVGASLFTFRTVLGLVALLALLFAVVMTSSKIVSWGKRTLVAVLAILFIGVIAGERIEDRASTLIEQVQLGSQHGNIQWRARRVDESGNQQSFAKYASSAVFAPMIFTIPLPTMVRPFEGQEVQQLLNGGNFTKNILSYFTIFALIMLLISGNWRNHILPLSFMIGYLIVLTMSSFAHSERFHQPAMAFEMMFMAYGLSVVVTKKKYRRWFIYWCVVMFIGAVAWNWFKLAGRGLA